MIRILTMQTDVSQSGAIHSDAQSQFCNLNFQFDLMPVTVRMARYDGH